MKNLTLMAALLAFACSACGGGGDGDKKTVDKSDAGDDINIPDTGDDRPFPSCERADVVPYPDYDGEPVWTTQDQMNCSTACGMVPDDQADACIMANCPGYEMFNRCVNGVLLSCLTTDDSDGACRADWETYICCANEKCDDVPEADQEACLDKSCKSYIDVVSQCIDDNGDPSANPPDPCIVKVVNRCIKQAPAAMSTQAQAAELRADRLFLRQLAKHGKLIRSDKAVH